ncbi:MAG: hypothetical protein V8S01_04745 [Dorea sp.]
MARNDGIDRTVARNQDIETADDLAKDKNTMRVKKTATAIRILCQSVPL